MARNEGFAPPPVVLISCLEMNRKIRHTYASFSALEDSVEKVKALDWRQDEFRRHVTIGTTSWIIASCGQGQ